MFVFALRGSALRRRPFLKSSICCRKYVGCSPLTGAFSGRPAPSARWHRPQGSTPSLPFLTIGGLSPRRSPECQSGISPRPTRSAPRVMVRSLPGMRITALSSAGRADGGGGDPAGGGGVYAHSGRPGGTGAADAGALCCATTTAPPRTTDAIATRARCLLHMFSSFWLLRPFRNPPTKLRELTAIQRLQADNGHVELVENGSRARTRP